MYLTPCHNSMLLSYNELWTELYLCWFVLAYLKLRESTSAQLHDISLIKLLGIVIKK